MVNAQNVAELGRTVNTANPPAVSVTAHGIIVVQGVAPKLTVFAEIIRRHACDLNGDIFLIQQEKLRACPHIGGVHGDIDGHIADYLNAVLVRVLMQSVPLLKEQQLNVLKKPHILV